MKIHLSYFPGLLAAAVLFSAGAAAQRGRHYGHERGHYGRPVRAVYLHGGYSVPYRGLSYHYYNGLFYRPMGAYFNLVAPPIGIRINVLPYGYRRMHLGSGIFFYFNGIFYRQYDRYYEVVTPPVGAEVTDLPEGSRMVVIDGVKYYEMNGTYFEESEGPNGEIRYTVVGKNGVLNTTPDNQTEVAPPQHDMGNTVDALPADSKPVVINGQKLYVSPEGVYYEEETDNNGTYYKIVGHSGKN